MIEYSSPPADRARTPLLAVLNPQPSLGFRAMAESNSNSPREWLSQSEEARLASAGLGLQGFWALVAGVELIIKSPKYIYSRL